MGGTGGRLKHPKTLEFGGILVLPQLSACTCENLFGGANRERAAMSLRADANRSLLSTSSRSDERPANAAAPVRMNAVSQSEPAPSTIRVGDGVEAPADAQAATRLGAVTDAPNVYPAGTMEVRPDDSMWKMAEQRLRLAYQERNVGREPTADEIATYRSRFISANPVGTEVAPGVKLKDIDLIRPGWRLSAPAVTLPVSQSGGGSGTGDARNVPNLPRRDQPPRTVPSRTPAQRAEAAAEAAVAESLRTGRTLSFENKDGETIRVRASRSGDGYRFQVGDDSFEVKIDGEGTINRDRALAKIADYFSQQPPESRRMLKVIEIHSEGGPTTAAGDDGRNQPAAATAWAEEGRIRFYRGEANLTKRIFDHEFGHFIGTQADNEQDSLLGRIGEVFSGPDRVPHGWDDAVKADGGPISDYAHNDHERDGDYTEDFADAWRDWQAAQDRGPGAVARFKEKYPNRTRILEAVPYLLS